jgi:hypothetical protein
MPIGELSPEATSASFSRSGPPTIGVVNGVGRGVLVAAGEDDAAEAEADAPSDADAASDPEVCWLVAGEAQPASRKAITRTEVRRM